MQRIKNIGIATTSSAPRNFISSMFELNDTCFFELVRNHGKAARKKTNIKARKG
jgi:hypothetical protein